ncbi:MAG: hypothetical protein LBB18_02685 [Puniceicoccales bacterium]|nr:hypothetical protein [Puniceicoccales bacterium]
MNVTGKISAIEHNNGAERFCDGEKNKNIHKKSNQWKKVSNGPRTELKTDVKILVDEKSLPIRGRTAKETTEPKRSYARKPGPERGGETIVDTKVAKLDTKVAKLFRNLKICSFAGCSPVKEKEREAALGKLAKLLQKKSPEILLKIFKNCQWLKNKAQDGFIYDVAIQSIKMEFCDFFDQSLDSAIRDGLKPTKTMLVPRTLIPRTYIEGPRKLLSNLAVLNDVHEKFYEWLDRNADELENNLNFNLTSLANSGRPRGTCSYVQCGIWHQWVYGEPQYIRDAVNYHILIDSKRPSSMPSAAKIDPIFAQMRENGTFKSDEFSVKEDFGEKCRKIVPHIAVSYAYTQMILRHVEFPGQIGGDHPHFHAVRMTDSSGLAAMFGEKFSDKPGAVKKCTYRRERALSAESWGMLSPADNNHYGDMGVYGQIPVFSIAAGFFSVRGISDIQRDLVLLPFDDFSVSVEKNMALPDFYRKNVIPVVKKQYGKDKYTGDEIREAEKLLEKHKK